MYFASKYIIQGWIMRNIKMRRLYITFAAMVMAGFMTACSGTAGISNAETVRTESSTDAAERNEIGTTENSKSEDRNDNLKMIM